MSFQPKCCTMMLMLRAMLVPVAAMQSAGKEAACHLVQRTNFPIPVTGYQNFSLPSAFGH